MSLSSSTASNVPLYNLQLSMIKSVITNGAGLDTEYTREGELTTVTFLGSTIKVVSRPALQIRCVLLTD